MTVLEQDTFIRGNTGGSTNITTGWGTASNGDTWIEVAGSGTLSIASNEGKITNQTSDFSAHLGSTIATNVEGLLRFTNNDFSGSDMGLYLRFTDQNNYYRIFCGKSLFKIDKKVAGTTTNVASTSFSPVNGTFYWMRVRMVGTSMMGKIWTSGSAEPGSWTWSATDSSLASGYVGLGGNLGVTTDVLQFDSFYVVDYAYSESYSILDSFSLSTMPGVTEISSLSETYALAPSFSRIEQLTSVDYWSTPIIDFNTLSEVFTSSSTYTQGEQLVESETWTRSTSPFLQETLSLLEHLTLQNTFAWSEQLSLTEILSALSVGVGAVPSPFLVPGLFAGLGILPIQTPRLPYAVNGIALDSQPGLMTAPISTGSAIFAGTQFYLGWTNPSTMVQNLFASGSILTLQFGLSDGSSRSALVQVQSTLTGNFLLAVCTLQQSSIAYSWVLPVQAS